MPERAHRAWSCLRSGLTEPLWSCLPVALPSTPLAPSRCCPCAARCARMHMPRSPSSTRVRSAGRMGARVCDRPARLRLLLQARPTQPARQRHLQFRDLGACVPSRQARSSSGSDAAHGRARSVARKCRARSRSMSCVRTPLQGLVAPSPHPHMPGGLGADPRGLGSPAQRAQGCEGASSHGPTVGATACTEWHRGAGAGAARAGPSCASNDAARAVCRTAGRLHRRGHWRACLPDLQLDWWPAGPHARHRGAGSRI